MGADLEAQTRKEKIDPALLKAGWNFESTIHADRGESTREKDFSLWQIRSTSKRYYEFVHVFFQSVSVVEAIGAVVARDFYVA